MSVELSRIARIGQAVRNRTPRQVHDPDRAPASVAVILAPDPDALLLIRRAEHPRDPWSGQMALPGGRFDPGDGDLRTTAIRETSEELGLDLTRAEFHGVLDDMAPITPVLPPINVRPHVFTLPAHPPAGALVLNAEVALAAFVPLVRFFEEGVLRPFTHTHGTNRTRRMGYHLDEGVVWGMTERILAPLFDLIRGVELPD